MKKYLLFLFLGFSVFSRAQDKINFDYDAAGNQIKRELCLQCTDPNNKPGAIKEIADLQEEDLQKFSSEDVISYYPNPVKEELYIKWEFLEGKAASSVYLYNLNGKVLKIYNHLEAANTLNIPFYNYPNATYLVVLVYNDGEEKSIKIVK